MGVEVYALRRRPRKERAALAFIRGEVSFEANQAALGQETQSPAARTQETVFARLRTLARSNGLVIRKPGAQFVDQDELLLLGWVAQAQRLAGLGPQSHPNERLRRVIGHCGKILESAGLRLPLRGNSAAPFHSIEIAPTRARAMRRKRRGEPIIAANLAYLLLESK
jgi:hypothetical protein